MIATLLLTLALFAQAATPTIRQDEPLTLPTISYPAEAKAARVQGTVHLEVAVDPTGHVFGVKAIDGPELLRQAAIDAYTHAIYKPLLTNGVPTPAIVTTAVNFSLTEAPPEPGESLSKLFQAAQAHCQQLSSTLSPEALSACRQAVDISHKFAPGVELESRTTSINDLVLLLIVDGKKAPQLPQAARLAEEAVDLVTGSTPHTPAVAVAYITRGEVRSLQGDLPGAASDCSIAEEALTTTLTDHPENERAGRYRVQLRETLLLHAVVLDRQGGRARKSDAAALRARAEQY